MVTLITPNSVIYILRFIITWLFLDYIGQSRVATLVLAYGTFMFFSQISFRYEPLNGGDELFLLDPAKNQNISSACMILEKDDFNAFYQHFLRQTKKHWKETAKFRKRIVRYFGKYYLKKIKNLAYRDYVIKSDRVLVNEGELQREAGFLLRKGFDPKKARWQFVHYSLKDGRAAVIMNFHQCYADGLSFITYCASFTDTPENTKLLETSRPSMWHKMGVFLLLPIFAIYYGVKTKFTDRSTDVRSPFKSVSLSGKKKTAVSKPICLKAVKNRASKLNVKVHDVLLAAFCQSVTNLYKNQLGSTEELPEYLRVLLPLPMRNLPRNRKMLPLTNNQSLLSVDLKIAIGKDEKYTDLIKELREDLENHPDAYLLHCLQRYLCMFPDRYSKKIFKKFTNAVDMVLVNCPGFWQKASFGGNPIQKCWYFPPVSGSIGLGCAVTSYDDQLYFSCVSDDRIMNNPAIFVASYEEAIVQFLTEAQK